MLCISVVGAEVRLYAFKVFIAVFGFSLIYYSVRKLVTSEGRMKGVFLSYIIIHIILIGMNPDVFLHPETRNYLTNAGYLGDGNDFALSICMVIPMAYYFVSRANEKSLRLFSLAAMVLFCMCVISTQSRGGTITLAVVLLYLVMCSRKKLMGLIIMAMLVASALVYAPEQYYERMDRIANYEQDGSAQGRILAWKAAVRMAMDDPLLGVGAGNFPTSYGTQFRPEGYGRTDLPWQTAHSIYFLALGELGIPGLLFLLILIGSNIIIVNNKLRTMKNIDVRKAENTERILVSLNGSIIAYAVGGAFLSVLYYPHIYILMGLISCGISIAARNTELQRA
jgi:probable O-glycosylation ligase (exosortase A-associated)